MIEKILILALLASAVPLYSIAEGYRGEAMWRAEQAAWFEGYEAGIKAAKTGEARN